MRKHGEVWQTDYHCHFLPSMDDGAGSVEEAVQMLELLYRQGIRCAFATPHYYAHQESAEGFLQRRADSLAALTPALQGKAVPQIQLGAEVLLHRGLSAMDLTGFVSAAGTLLLELPYTEYRPWMLAEIENIAYGNPSVTPILAHIERYLPLYKAADYESLFSMERVVLQCNTRVFASRRSRRFFKRCMQTLPLVLGSDAHNMGERKPQFSAAEKYIRRYGLTEPLIGQAKHNTKIERGDFRE